MKCFSIYCLKCLIIFLGQFNPPIFHPNVFPSGTVSLSLIENDTSNGWKPQTTLKEVT